MEDVYNIKMDVTRDYKKSSSALKKIVREIDYMIGQGMTLISLYIKADNTKEKVFRFLLDKKNEYINAEDRNKNGNKIGLVSDVMNIIDRYEEIPYNGIIIFYGAAVDKYKKVSMVNVTIKPSKPIQKDFFILDNRCHVYQFKGLLGEEEISDDSTILNVM